MVFAPELSAMLPETHTLLQAAKLILHPAVERVVLHGSRGPAGGCRPDSDIDLSLLVDLPPGVTGPDLERLLAEVAETTLRSWHGAVELDLAVIFDINDCKLVCFDQRVWNGQCCTPSGVDCFGLYKTQRGFNGIVTNAGVQVRLMYPCLKIWQRQ